MKKIYLKPEMVIMEIETEQMIAASRGNSDMLPINPEDTGNPAAKERNGWDEGLW